MKALSTLAILAASVAVAQAPAVLRPPKNDVPPVIPVEQAQTFLGGIYSATVDGGDARLCITPDGQGWECMLTAGDTAEKYMDTSTANAALDELGARIDGVADAGVSHGDFDAGMSALSARVTSLEASAVTSAQLASAVATLNSRITTVESLAGTGKTLCNSISVVGINIPLAGVSPPTNVAIPGAQANRPCFVAPASNLPLTAHPECSSSSGGASISFRAAGLLGALSIPTGTYAACVVNQ